MKTQIFKWIPKYLFSLKYSTVTPNSESCILIEIWSFDKFLVLIVLEYCIYIKLITEAGVGPLESFSVCVCVWVGVGGWRWGRNNAHEKMGVSQKREIPSLGFRIQFGYYLNMNTTSIWILPQYEYYLNVNTTSIWILPQYEYYLNMHTTSIYFSKRFSSKTSFYSVFHRLTPTWPNMFFMNLIIFLLFNSGPS